MSAASAGRWLFGIVAVAALARLILIGGESYWFDEIWAVKQVRGELGTVLSSLAKEDVHPPLYPILLWGWIRMMGEAEWATRLFSAVVGTGAVAVLYALGRDLFNRRVGLVAAAILAVHAFAVYYSQETRCYSLMLFLATLATWALVRWEQAPTSRRRAVAYVLAGVALAYVHVFAIFVLLAHGIWALTLPHLRVRMVVAGAVIFAAFAPWLPFMLGQVDRVQEGFWIDPMTWTDPLKWLWYWSGYNIPLLLLLVPLIVVGFRQSTVKQARLLALIAVFPVAIPVLLSIIGEPIFHHKYPIAILAPLCLAAAVGLLTLKPARRHIAAAALAGLLVVGLPFTVYLKVDKEQYREIAELAVADERGGAGLISEDGMRHYIGFYLDPALVNWLEDDVSADDLVDLARAHDGHLTYLLVHPRSTEREAVLAELFERVEVIELRSARAIRYRLLTE
ncbi:MAG: mannosyltransferase [Myxococcota bacterium]|jgi:mannosyltransferase